MSTESEANLLTRCRRMVSNEVYCDVYDLVVEVSDLCEFRIDTSSCNQYLVVSEWLYFKLIDHKQDTIKFNDLYLWARETTTDDVLYMDDVIQDIVSKIMVDYEKL